MDRVSIPRGALVALVVALAVALVAVAFLLGRESVRGDTAASAPATAAPVVMTATSTPQAEFAVRAVPNATPVTVAAPPPAPAPTAPPPAAPRVTVAAPPPAPAPTPAHAPTTSSGPDAALKAQVQAYFHEMDNIQPGTLSGDPQSMANDVLQGAMSGDTRQLDDLIRKGEASERRARAIHPPSPCAGYHQRAVALSADSVRMLRTMKSAMAGGDTSALMSLSARASQMQTQAQQLQQEEEQLKARYR